MFFVDELDCDDRLGFIVRDGFAYARLLSVYEMPPSRRSTNDAYAPCPMVLLTRRKGRFDGSGATWLYDTC
jgi:hypothetical protein